jgi:hypothetical protein
MRAVRTWYVLSTYQGHIYAPCYSLRHSSHCNFAVTAAISPCLPSTYQENLQQIPYVLGMAECCIGLYHAIVQYHLVLLCTSTYRYLSPCNAVHHPGEFWFSVWYTVHTVINARCSVLIAVCTVYQKKTRIF